MSKAEETTTMAEMPVLNLYLLERMERGAAPGEVRGFVAAGPDEARARQRCATQAGAEGQALWRDPERSSCTLIGTTAGRARTGVVLRDVRPVTQR